MVTNKKRILKLLEKRTEYVSSCWLYNGYITIHGYGEMKLFNGLGGRQLVHRLSAWIHFDYDLNDKEHQINHKLECKHPSCWNPDHLYIGTQQDNMQDVLKSKNHYNTNKEVCKRGHPLNGINIKTNQRGARVCRACEKYHSEQRTSKQHQKT